MENLSKVETPKFFPYTERNSIGVENNISELLSNPETALLPEETEELFDFAHRLYFANQEDAENCDCNMSLEEIYMLDHSSGVATFYVDYFLTSDGQIDLGLMGIEETDKEAIKSQLNRITHLHKTTEAKIIREVAAKSLDWYNSYLSECLKGDPVNDFDFKDSETLQINYEPEKLVAKLEGFYSYRKYYKQILHSLIEGQATRLNDAETLLTEIYLARVNDLLLDLSVYQDALSLAEQLNSNGDKDSQIYRTLVRLLPIVKTIFREETDKHALKTPADFTRRLDLLKYGAGSWQGENISPVSEEAMQIADELEQTVSPVEKPIAKVPTEVIEKLSLTKWQSAQVKDFAQSVLIEMGLLSDHETEWLESELRDGPANDGKWQVIISPEHKIFHVSRDKKILYVPQKFDRTLIQVTPAGTLPAIAHELTHVLQTEENYKLGEKIPIARIKGRRCSTGRELGALIQERKMQAFFGHARGVNTHYLRAMQVKVLGGNKLEVARAYFEAAINRTNNPQKKEEKVRKQAAKNILRLYRRKGFNSQPLDYLEQEAINRQINNLHIQQKEAIITLLSSFNLREAALLHKKGMLDLPAEPTKSSADVVWKVFEQKYLPNI